MRMLKMSEEERNAFFKAVDTAMDFVYEVFTNSYFYGFSKIGGDRKDVETIRGEVGQERYLELYSALCVVGGWKLNSPFINFRALFAMNTRDEAVKYAYDSFAGGFLASKVLCMLETAEALRLPGFDPQGEVKEAIQTLKDFADKRKAIPVLVKFEIEDPGDVCYEDGTEIDATLFDSWCDSGTYLSVKVLRDISEGEIEYLPKIDEQPKNI